MSLKMAQSITYLSQHCFNRLKLFTVQLAQIVSSLSLCQSNKHTLPLVSALQPDQSSAAVHSSAVCIWHSVVISLAHTWQVHPGSHLQP